SFSCSASSTSAWRAGCRTPIEHARDGTRSVMPLATRRTFRLGAVAALSLALAYGFATPLPFLAPLFAIVLTATPAPPMGPKALLGLLAVMAITLGTGLALTPVLRLYPVSGVLLVATGLFVSTYLG